MKKAYGSISVKIWVDCPYCDEFLDVANTFYGTDDPIDPFSMIDGKHEHLVECSECNREFIIEQLEFF